jgi:hypothetical protein
VCVCARACVCVCVPARARVRVCVCARAHVVHDAISIHCTGHDAVLYIDHDVIIIQYVDLNVISKLALTSPTCGCRSVSIVC